MINVDFNKFAIPQNIRTGKDIYDLIEYSNRPEIIRTIASLIRFVHEDDQFLRFVFVHNKRVYYTQYNKTKRISKTYNFEDSNHNYQPTPFLHVKDNRIYIALISINEFESNPFLVVFNEDVFE